MDKKAIREAREKCNWIARDMNYLGGYICQLNPKTELERDLELAIQDQFAKLRAGVEVLKYLLARGRGEETLKELLGGE